MAALNPTPIRLAQTLGLTTAAILGGYHLCHTAVIIPTLHQSPPQVALKQFVRIYNSGKVVGPSCALVTFSSILYLAYDSFARFADPALVYSPLKDQWKGYLLSAAVIIGIVPYTLVCMSPGVNKELLHMAEKVESGKGEALSGVEVRELLTKWGKLNLGRAAFSVGGAVLAVWTATM